MHCHGKGISGGARGGIDDPALPDREPGKSGDILSRTLPHLRCWRTIPMGRLSLYLVGIYGVAAAYLVYLNRRGPVTRNGRIPVTKAAEMLREAWADHHTTA
jgi:hypothetical protein